MSFSGLQFQGDCQCLGIAKVYAFALTLDDGGLDSCINVTLESKGRRPDVFFDFEELVDRHKRVGTAVIVVSDCSFSLGNVSSRIEE